MSNSRKPRRGEIHWGIKLHLDTLTVDETHKPLIPKHQSYRMEGKERPLLVLKDRVAGRAGCGEYNVAYVTSKNLDSKGKERGDLVPFTFRQGTPSFAEIPTDNIPENLIKRYETELHEQLFREIKKKLAVLAMQSMMKD